MLNESEYFVYLMHAAIVLTHVDVYCKTHLLAYAKIFRIIYVFILIKLLKNKNIFSLNLKVSNLILY